VHHGDAVAERTLTSRTLAVRDLPQHTAAFIRGQGAVRGLSRDPLAEVTHGLRTDEETIKKRLFGAPRTKRRTVEMLLTPDLLIISYRDGSDEDVDPAAQVSFNRLYQLEFSAAPAELLARVTGTAVEAAVPPGLMPVSSTPVGATSRATRYVPVGTGPEVAHFREALMTAVERARRGAGA
jgi:hypothetical protein